MSLNVGDLIPIGGTGNAQPADVLVGKTFTNDDGPDKVGTMPNNGPSTAETINLTNQNQEYTVARGYHSGLRKIKAVFSGLVASVIKAGTTVGGIVGTFTADANASAENIDYGKSAYVNGAKIEGAKKLLRGEGTVPSDGKIVVSGLPFGPAGVAIFSSQYQGTGTYTWRARTVFNGPVSGAERAMMEWYWDGFESRLYGGSFIDLGDTNKLRVTSDGFTCGGFDAGANYYWIAWVY